MNLTVEVSRRANLADGHIIEVQLAAAYAGGVADVKVQVLDSQAIAVTKVLALTDPNRLAPRDLFDLHVLIEAQVNDPTHLFASLPNARERLLRAIADLWPKIEAMTYAQFRSDVVPNLPDSVAKAIGEDVFDDMRLKVGASVEKWLIAATEAPVTAPGSQNDLLPTTLATKPRGVEP